MMHAKIDGIKAEPNLTAATAVIVALGVMVATNLGACCDEEVDVVSLYINQNNLPGKGCLAAQAKNRASSGLLDVDTRLRLGYYMFPAILNNLVGTSSTDNQPERNNLQMKRLDVSIDLGRDDLNVGSSALEYSVLQSGMIQPGAEVVFGPVMVIGNDLAMKLGTLLCIQPPYVRPVISVTLRAVAELNGEMRQSPEFVYPITLCCGCLVDWRQVVPSTGDPTVRTNPCGAPQDFPVSCYAGPSGTVCLRDSST